MHTSKMHALINVKGLYRKLIIDLMIQCCFCEVYIRMFIC